MNYRWRLYCIFYKSLEEINNLSCGANMEEHHYVGLNINRDIGEVEYHDLAKIKEDSICPSCRKHALSEVRRDCKS